MSAHLLRRLNLGLLFPPFLHVVLSVVERCHQRGCDYWGTYGLRTYQEQAALYAAWKAKKGGRAAPPGLSAHQYGAAIDLVADADENPRNGLQPDWRGPEYDVLGEEVRAAGLLWGGSFNDSPHVQWPGYTTGNQLMPLRALLVARGQQAALPLVWAHFEAERRSPTWQANNPRLSARLQLLGLAVSPVAPQRKSA